MLIASKSSLKDALTDLEVKLISKYTTDKITIEAKRSVKILLTILLHTSEIGSY